MDAFLAGLSQSIDAVELGRRIRAARIAAGMTQSQVAGGEVSAAYVSRIEDGQRRPETQLLARMAARMSTTPHQLLTGITTHEARQLELEVEHAAVALTLGDNTEALTAAADVVARLKNYGDPALLAEAQRVKAQAHYALSDLDSAISILEELTQQLTPDMNTLRALISLCRCYCDRDELARATALGDLAERMATRMGIDGLTETLQLAVVRAEIHLRRGDHQAAAATCRSALEIADADASELAQASAYWHASVSEALSNGATPAALELAKIALALIDISEGHTCMRHLTRISSA
ncbi:helix-turn-helix transcriptional regulator [Nocardioides sp. WS12]|uniref:helix-turn-helix domain-containing protein n=1 Tax=Nocardioides sp. WS12 TaxID=2486272 RepID=UPI0015FCE02E|nr:helix-turn-helix transcriptional regulator [Nocardioides sp. WS12]